MTTDPFDEVLGLEEQFYDDGYKAGLSDGISAGRIEGRTFGLEKGFDKYVEMGRLHGKSLVWANRVHSFQKPTTATGTSSSSTDTARMLEEQKESPDKSVLPELPKNERLAKHVKVLYALAEAESLSTENTEEAVSDFDDRLKRAQAKAKIIERMVGEGSGHGGPKSSGDGAIEDVSVMTAR